MNENQSPENEKWVCHECKEGNCASCVGVPCHCGCLPLSTMSEDLEGYRNELEQWKERVEQGRKAYDFIAELAGERLVKLNALEKRFVKAFEDSKILNVIEKAMVASDSRFELNGYSITRCHDGWHVAVDQISEPLIDACSLRDAVRAAIGGPSIVAASLGIEQGDSASKLLEERNEARAEAQRLRGLLWDAADRFRQIRDEPTSNAASDWDIVREMEATAKDALVELNTEGDLDPEPKSGEVL